MEFLVESTKGKKFEATLEEGEWVDYDEKLEASVGIYKLESKFQASGR